MHTRNTIIRIAAACAVFVLAVLGSACVMAPVEVRDMRRDIAEMRLKMDDLNMKMQDLSRRVDYSFTQIDQKLAIQKESLGAATRDIQDQLGRMAETATPTKAGSPATVAPTLSDRQSEALLAGHEAYSRGEYDTAIQKYSEFLQNYPKSEKAAEAAFCLSRSWYMKSDFEKAQQGFERIAQEYPGNDIVPKALHSKALCEIRMSKLPDAVATLGVLMTQHADYEPEKVKALKESIESGAIQQP